ncbi:unannotated protein [freshwater metagenome]|uniref:Unannotated protein n=1 Tax=freshwater metagenome TaxID=449393 RepID=A0A6J6D9B0_9ZZZZ
MALTDTPHRATRRAAPRSSRRRRAHRRVATWTAIAASGVLVLPVEATSAAPAPATATAPDGALTDPALLDLLDEVPDAARVVVEVVTDDTASARADVRSLGAVVTGSVPGEVLQVSVAAGRVERLLDVAGADDVRLPRVANRPVRHLEAPRVEFGAVTGENVAVTDAAAWHAQGLRGGVRVGIIDFFDLSLWNPTEHGDVPPVERRFCRDTIQVGPNAPDNYCTSPTQGVAYAHGVAVAEVVKDVAPDAELWLATVAGSSDLSAAIDWFAANGVRIVTRSLGAAYDGPGDGTGPLAAVVDRAASLGITWFNSAGNDAGGSYGRFTEGVDEQGYVDFLPGPGVDTTLTISTSGTFGRVGFDGIRWSDWNEPRSRVTDYRLEITTPFRTEVVDASQRAGAPPLEAVDLYIEGPIQLRIRRVATGGDPTPDVVEVGLFEGRLEYFQTEYSAAKPVVDSRSPALVAVGAIDPPTSARIAWYSSQGPTNDGRVKPDVSAPSCVSSSIFNPARFGIACFNGTSAAAPTAAGVAALLLARGLAGSGVPLAALTKHLVVDLGTPGADQAFGSGMVRLPPPPAAALDPTPTQYVPLAEPRRILDTRPASATPGARLGPHPRFTIIDVPLPADLAGATAVAIGVVSTDTAQPGYVQALPTLQGEIGASSTLNVAVPGQIQPNLAVVPVGARSTVTLYLFAGGNVVVDLLGAFRPAPVGPVAEGRFIAIDPVRVLDTRPESGGPVPTDWVPRRPEAGDTVRVEAIPAGASAAVVNVVADQAVASGFVRTQASGVAGLATSNGNFVPGVASGTLSIVPVGADGTISVFTSASTHLVVDLMGWITGPTSTPGRDGLFVPVAPTRVYDSRTIGGIHERGTDRRVQVSGGVVPAGASAVSMNLTSDQSAAPGYLTVHPADVGLPLISNLNYPTVVPQANAGMVRLSADGGLKTFVNQTTHVIIDVNGYFTGPT